MDNNCELTIEKLAPLIQRKKISPVELTRFLLDRISQFQPSINAYITVTSENAIAQARQAEREIVKGRYRGVLHGIPISLKDLFYTKQIRTTAGSKILEKHLPANNATVVDRLLSAGCILLGKANMHEFAYGPTNINPHYGSVRNPWDPGRISGGSSGGSAASVISAQAIASLGTDTGGSIRIPASACGCVGLKPTYGRVPTDGVIPLSFSLDHVGPLSRCVIDAAFLYEVIAEPALRNSNLRRFIGEIRRGVKSFIIGIPRQYFFDRIQPEVRKAILAAIEVFEQLGATICEVDLPGMEDTARLAAEITGDEAVSYHEKWLQQKPQDYGEDVRTRLEPNRKTTAVAYIQALQAMRAYGERFDKVMKSVCILLAQTLTLVAPLLDQKEVRIGRSGEDIRLALLRLTRPGNLSGLPAISIPCGFSSEGLPVGLQLIGRQSDESTLLRAAYAYETATTWHKQFPPDANYQIQTTHSKRKPKVMP
jgi:aspartyl-tRNA(Asn)/glutamyl-tRNA(Gln) amidotransferase subunit A